MPASLHDPRRLDASAASFSQFKARATAAASSALHHSGGVGEPATRLLRVLLVPSGTRGRSV